MLPLAAKELDFVVLMVDIDHGPEMKIVEAIAARPVWSTLVDEMFFEYHYVVPGNRWLFFKRVSKKAEVVQAVTRTTLTRL